MNILNSKISAFQNTRSLETIKGTDLSIGDWLSKIEHGEYRDIIDKLRSGEETQKLKLPTIAFHGLFDGFRRKSNFIEASGLIIIDIDDVEVDDIEEIKFEIMDECDHVLAAMISPSGNGIKLLYYVEPDLINADNYRQIGKTIAPDFEIYGSVDYLSVTDCLIATYDENILINENAVPAFIYIKDTIKSNAELEPLDTNKKLWEDPEDFFDTVLANDIEAKTNNNFHYIQVSILDLAKFGFTHPKEDLSFVVDYAEAAFNKSPRNHQRFLEVTELASGYPQLKWPYKTIESEYPDDEYVDYSQYMDDEELGDNEEDADDDSNESEIEGLVKYNTLFESVLEVIKEGDRVGFETSHSNFADVFRFRGSGILTITGIPSHGKTEFVDSIITDLARLYGHETVVAGFEQSPEEHIIKLIRKTVGTNITCPSYMSGGNEEELKKAYNFITDKIKHIDTRKTSGNVNEILEICAKQIKKSRNNGGDPKYIVLDPFNMLSIKGKFSGHEKIEEILRRITHFSHQMNVLVILVAHPFKMKKDENGVYEIPDFYSVKGSSAFFEMSYHGLVVYRTGYQTTDPVLVGVLKVKQNNLGITGEKVYFTYDRPSGRYIPVDTDGNELSGDHRDKDWLNKINIKN